MGAYHAALRGTDADRETLSEHFAAMERAHANEDPTEEAERDADFHYAIAEASHNTVLMHVMRGLLDLLRRDVIFNRMRLYKRPDARDVLLRQHRAIYAAIMARDAEAARAAAQDTWPKSLPSSAPIGKLPSATIPPAAAVLVAVRPWHRLPADGTCRFLAPPRQNAPMNAWREFRAASRHGTASHHPQDVMCSGVTRRYRDGARRTARISCWSVCFCATLGEILRIGACKADARSLGSGARLGSVFGRVSWGARLLARHEFTRSR